MQKNLMETIEKDTATNSLFTIKPVPMVEVANATSLLAVDSQNSQEQASS